MKHLMKALAALAIASTLISPFAHAGDTVSPEDAPGAASAATNDPALLAKRRYDQAMAKLDGSLPSYQDDLRSTAAIAEDYIFAHPSDERALEMLHNWAGLAGLMDISVEEYDARLAEMRAKAQGTPAESIFDILDAAAANSWHRRNLEYIAELEKILLRWPSDPHVLGELGVRLTRVRMDDAARLARADELLAKEELPPGARKILAGWRFRTGMVGQPVSFKFTDLNGVEIDTADWKGKVILVDFWATWCGPCVAELPRVRKAYDKHHAEGLEVIGVSCDKQVEKLEKFVAKRGLPWPQWPPMDDTGWHPEASKWGIRAIPTMFLIDKRGILRSVESRGKFEEMIPALLAEEL